MVSCCHRLVADRLDAAAHDSKLVSRGHTRSLPHVCCSTFESFHRECLRPKQSRPIKLESSTSPNNMTQGVRATSKLPRCLLGTQLSAVSGGTVHQLTHRCTRTQLLARCIGLPLPPSCSESAACFPPVSDSVSLSVSPAVTVRNAPNQFFQPRHDLVVLVMLIRSSSLQTLAESRLNKRRTMLPT